MSLAEESALLVALILNSRWVRVTQSYPGHQGNHLNQSWTMPVDVVSGVEVATSRRKYPVALCDVARDAEMPSRQL